MTGPSIAHRLDEINRRIHAAAQRSGRNPADVHLLAVSKGQSVEKIRAAYDHGQKLFAENYVQEVLVKLDQLANLRAEWHFIGRIQSNKIKNLVGRFHAIHSVDRLSIAEALQRQAGSSPQKIFIQYNVAGETSKGGGGEDEVRGLARAISNFENLEVMGLMVMPPLFDDAEKARPYFKQARALAGELGFKELSMGTSGDFEVAIEEGATYVRIGTDVFGPREV